MYLNVYELWDLVSVPIGFPQGFFPLKKELVSWCPYDVKLFIFLCLKEAFILRGTVVLYMAKKRTEEKAGSTFALYNLKIYFMFIK